MEQNHNSNDIFLYDQKTSIELRKIQEKLTHIQIILLDELARGIVNTYTMESMMGINDPSARIEELQRMGFDIITEMKVLQKPDGTSRSFAHYRLKDDEQ